MCVYSSQCTDIFSFIILDTEKGKYSDTDEESHIYSNDRTCKCLSSGTNSTFMQETVIANPGKLEVAISMDVLNKDGNNTQY